MPTGDETSADLEAPADGATPDEAEAAGEARPLTDLGPPERITPLTE